jgi:pimeloyl-ACP methyl ester carboxylesterase
LAASAWWWRRNLAALSSRYRVHLIDLPGFGGMGRRRGRLDLSAMPEWLAEWMEVAIAGPAAGVVGHSMGAMVALRVAAQRPDLVSRLVLVAPAGIPTGRGALGQLAPLAWSLRLRPTWLVARACRDAIAAGPVMLCRCVRSILADDVRADLERVAMPTLVVWGEHDELVPIRLRDEIDPLPNVRHTVVAGAAHVPMAERPLEFNRIVLGFLDEPHSQSVMNGSTSAATSPGAE